MLADELPALNLPDYSARLRMRRSDNLLEIYDPTRRLWLKLTPEEWVRQNMILYLSDRLELPLSHFRNEAKIEYNGLTRRCDTIVYTRQGHPMLIAEYKRPDVPLTQTVFNQAAVYGLGLGVEYLALSNGMTHYLCLIDRANRRYVFSNKLNYNG